MKKLESEKKKVESDYNATNSRIQVDFDDHDSRCHYENIDDFFEMCENYADSGLLFQGHNCRVTF